MKGQYFTAHGKVNERDRRTDLSAGKYGGSDAIRALNNATTPERDLAAEAAETLERIRRRREEIDAASGMPSDPDVVRIGTAARITGVSADKIRFWVRSGACPIAGRFGRRALVSLAAVKQVRARKADKRRKVRAKKKRKRLEAEEEQKSRDSGEPVVYFSEYYANNRPALLKDRREYYKRNKKQIRKREKALRLSKKTN